MHSPFAFSVITEVIEEKLPYYAYQPMKRIYPQNGPVPFKVACLLLRLANRFRCRTIVEVGCDGGYSLLPVALTDTRNRIYAVTDAEGENRTRQHLSWFKTALGQTHFVSGINDLPADVKVDMIIVNSLAACHCDDFQAWVLSHLTEQGIVFVKGIQPGRPHEAFWDALCDRDEIQVTMDMYDYGLAIRRPNFFKQHYIVSF